MPADPSPFQLRKIGHVVLNVADLDASVRFYTEVLGLEVSDRYPDSMVPGGMIFLRFNTDHHGIALVGGKARVAASSLNHFAFEVGTLDEVFRARAWLRERGVPMVFEGRRRAGCQVAIEFRDPDDNNLEIYWNIDQIGTNSTARPASEWRQAKSLEDAVKDPVAGQRLPQDAEKGPSAEVRRPRPPCHVTREIIGRTNFRLRGPDMAPHSPYETTPRVACRRAPPRIWTFLSILREAQHTL